MDYNELDDPTPDHLRSGRGNMRDENGFPRYFILWMIAGVAFVLLGQALFGT